MSTHTTTAQELALFLGDNTLILAQRLSEWCGHGPVLEQDIALTNIALDLLGQAQLYLAYVAELEGQGRTEDDIAYLRAEHQYRNLLLTEQDNGDWAVTIARQFLFDAWHYYYVKSLCDSKDERLAAIAAKAFKEVTYHLRYSSEWVIRLGDGTDVSKQKMQHAINELWRYTGEMFDPMPWETSAATDGIAPDLAAIAPLWEQKVRAVLAEATLTLPEPCWMLKGGKKGVHTEPLGYLLAEMQYMQRAYPGAKW